MDPTLAPNCWRSEAFAEDLSADDLAKPLLAVAPAAWRTRVLLGALPLLLVTAGVAMAAWGLAV